MAISINLNAGDRAVCNEIRDRVGGPLSASVQVAVGVAGKVIAFRRVYTEQPDAGAVDFQRIAVDDAGVTEQVGGRAAQVDARSDRAMMSGKRTSDPDWIAVDWNNLLKRPVNGREAHQTKRTPLRSP